MRTWGRINGGVDGVGGTWVKVETDAGGFNDQVYYTTLCQVLKLGLNESPFFANYGIPAQQSVATQVFPDWYAMQTQTQFSAYFASLVITRIPGTNPPRYTGAIMGHAGAELSNPVAV